MEFISDTLPTEKYIPDIVNLKNDDYNPQNCNVGAERKNEDMETKDIENYHADCYEDSILEHLKNSEAKYQSDDYMPKQTDINTSMRAILVDWLIEVAQEYKMPPETIFLGVNYVDRYLSKKKVDRGALQLIGITCLWIAYKFDDRPTNYSIDEAVYICDNIYKKEEILDAEEVILNTLSFYLNAPTIRAFVMRYLRIEKVDKKVEFLACYLCEISLLDYRLKKYFPSMIATVSISMALYTLELFPWTQTLEKTTGYKIADTAFQECLEQMHQTYKKSGLWVAGNSKLVAIKDKYSSDLYQKVSSILPPQCKPCIIQCKVLTIRKMPKAFDNCARKASSGTPGYKISTIHVGNSKQYLHVCRTPSGKWTHGHVKTKK